VGGRDVSEHALIVQITTITLSERCQGGNAPPNYRRFTARLSRAWRWREADPAGGKLRCVSQSHFRQSRASRFGQRVWRVELLTDLCH
jgi:hypothetical protein